MGMRKQGFDYLPIAQLAMKGSVTNCQSTRYDPRQFGSIERTASPHKHAATQHRLCLDSPERLVRNVRVQMHWKRIRCFGVRSIVEFLKTILAGVFLCLSIGPLAAQANSKNVLVLFSSFGRNTAWLDKVEPPIRARVAAPITFYEAYIEDTPDAENESYRQSMAEAFRRRYSGKNLDLILTDGPRARKFIEQYRDTIFPGVPIVFTAVSTNELEGERREPGETGVADVPNLRETIDLVLQLQPDTKAIAIISGASPWDDFWRAALHSELLRRQDKLQEFDLVGPSNDEIIKMVDSLPPHTVAMFQMNPQDSNQPVLKVDDLLYIIERRLPTYSLFPGWGLIGDGIGGIYHDAAKQLARTEEMAAQVLNGIRPEQIPIARQSDLQVRVNWGGLQRWHIAESALPVGSVILNRPPSLWDSYRKYVIAVSVVILVLLLLIAELLWERARKRKAEALLRESERRFRVMADTTPSLLWMCDSHGRTTYLNERRLAFTGLDTNAGYGDSWMEYVHPDHRRNVADLVAQGLKDHQAFSTEYRLRRSDGAYRWMFEVASPRLNGDGSFAGFIGSAIDVTDQKLAQEALERVSGKLIEAQENERRRIARELHDDICQKLALLSIELDQADRGANEAGEVTKHKLQKIRQHCGEIAGDVQSLAHELHSSRLDYLGIVAAIRGFCLEFSKQHKVSIEFTDRDVPRDLPRDLSLCLFRVTQEALHNAVKYSGVSRYAVDLSATVDGIQLVVTDSGAGFDVDAAKKKHGLGLVSMHERVNLVHGMFSVESRPGQGTKILVVVPLASRADRPTEDTALEEPEGMIGAG